MTPAEILSASGLLLSGVLVPLFLMLRGENRGAIQGLREELATLRAELHQVEKALVALTATLTERDRIGRMLDERLPRLA